MYPTLIVIVCAIDKSLNEKAADECMRNGLIVVADGRHSRPQAAISQLLNNSTDDTAASSEIPKDEDQLIAISGDFGSRALYTSGPVITPISCSHK